MRAAELGARLREHPAAASVQLAVLHGSRARGSAGPDSDWDVGVIVEGEPDLPALVAALTGLLGTDRIDVVDLRPASALLRYRAARDGTVLVDRSGAEFERFQLEAVLFWCDAGPVIRQAQRDVLASLG